MAKVCALCALGFLLGVFFGFGGLFFRLLRVVRAHMAGKDDGLVTVRPVLDRVSCFAGKKYVDRISCRSISLLSTYFSSIYLWSSSARNMSDEPEPFKGKAPKCAVPE